MHGVRRRDVKSSILFPMSESDPPTLDYATPRPQKWVTVKTYQNSMEAQLAGTLLRREGVVCQIDGEVVTTTLGIYGPGVAKIQVRVLEEDEEVATRLLDEIEEKRRERLKRTVRCPQCGGRAGQRTHPARKWMWALVIVSGAMLLFLQNDLFCIGVSVGLAMVVFWPLTPRWRCSECHHDFRAPEPPEWEEDTRT